jgi:transcriptional regulator with XRE-family HTH domain
MMVKKSVTKMSARSRNSHDEEIAKRVRALRLQRGLSQSQLSSVLQVTPQQVQKYEKGTDRISAGRLQQIAEVLQAPVAFFYEGGGECEGPSHAMHDGVPNGTPIALEFDFLQTGEAMRLVRAYAQIPNRSVRLQLLRLAESMVEGDAGFA